MRENLGFIASLLLTSTIFSMLFLMLSGSPIAGIGIVGLPLCFLFLIAIMARCSNRVTLPFGNVHMFEFRHDCAFCGKPLEEGQIVRVQTGHGGHEELKARDYIEVKQTLLFHSKCFRKVTDWEKRLLFGYFR